MSKKLLAKRRHSVTSAHNASDALVMLEAGERFDVALSGFMIPGEMDSVDWARIIRERWPWIGIVLAAGYSEAVTEARMGLRC
jgi:CheY-like chemotaxis protein